MVQRYGEIHIVHLNDLLINQPLLRILTFLLSFCSRLSKQVNYNLSNRTSEAMAVDKEIMRSNPLEDIEYEKVKRNVEIRYLTREQVKMLLAHPFQQRQMELARLMLLFTVFTGLAYVDLTRLRPEHIQTDAKGRRFIRKCRQHRSRQRGGRKEGGIRAPWRRDRPPWVNSVKACNTWSGNSSCSSPQSLPRTRVPDGYRTRRVPLHSSPLSRRAAIPLPFHLGICLH